MILPIAKLRYHEERSIITGKNIIPTISDNKNLLDGFAIIPTCVRDYLRKHIDLFSTMKGPSIIAPAAM